VHLSAGVGHYRHPQRNRGTRSPGRPDHRIAAAHTLNSLIGTIPRRADSQLTVDVSAFGVPIGAFIDVKWPAAGDHRSGLDVASRDPLARHPFEGQRLPRHGPGTVDRVIAPGRRK
jgi:hypothetical protein